jgi:hypothetical protein
MSGQPSLFDPPKAGVGLSDPGARTRGRTHRAGRDTERAAAELIEPKTGTQRAAVLAAIAAAPDGLTDEQIADTTGLYLYSAAPRRTELVKGGWVHDSGERRTTSRGTPAVVWVLTAAGRAALERSAA